MAKRKEVARILVFLLVVTFLVFGGIFYVGFYEKPSVENVVSEDHFFSTPILINEANYYSLKSDASQDIFYLVKSLDGLYSPRIYSGDIIEVKFIEELNNKNDFKINVFNPENFSFFVEIYENNSRLKVGEFNEISSSGEFRTYLLNLKGESDSFYLKFYSLSEEGYLLIDYITDPTTGGTTTGGLRPQTVVCVQQGSTTACDGTYPASCTTGDYLSCNDANEEIHTTRKSDAMSVEGTYFDTGVTDCVYIDKVEACYRWRSSDSRTSSCYFNFDESGDGYSAVHSTCPTATETSGCSDVTSSDTWACSNFFGSTGNRAKLVLGATNTQNPTSTVYVDEMWYNVTYTSAGTISGTLNDPSTAGVTTETIYETFILNATVQCSGSAGEVCGTITAMPRYNGTGALPTDQISSTPGALPLFVNTGNQTCEKLNATTGEDTCIVTWTVNATQKGDYELDVLFTSEYSVVPSDDTLDAQIQVLGDPVLTINLTSPLTDPGISEGDSFDITCQASCENQDCSDVVVGLLFCEGSLGCSPDTILDTGSIGLSANVSSINLGIVSPGISENAVFSVTGDLPDDYVLQCNSSSSNGGSSTSSENLSFNVNDRPVADFTYPLPSEWLHGTEILNGSDSTDSDGTVENYHFEIDDNLGFATPLTICDSSSETCSLDTKAQTECGNETSTCYLRLNVTDDDITWNTTIIQIGIDNIGPTSTLGVPYNDTYITTESQLINSSILDLGSGVDCVEFDAYYDGGWNSLNVDCSNPYEHTWDLSGVSDQTGIEIRARANDSETNFGSYDFHGNIIHDTTLPVVISDSPLEDEIIDVTNYLLNATSSYDVTAGIQNASWYYYDGSWNLIGSDVVPADGLTHNWVIAISDGVYDIMVNITDNAGLENFTLVQNVVLDTQNDVPYCIVNYPSGGENLSGQVLINATAVEMEPADSIQNATFEYSSDGGNNWDLIGSNLTSGLSEYTFSWDSSLGIDSSTYLIRCNVSDTRTGVGTNISSSNFTIDNTAPLISNPFVNSTDVVLNTPVCMNVTVTDNLAGVSSVFAEVDLPVGPNENATLLDDGLGCDLSSGDGVYSIMYTPIYAGDFNWTTTYAFDEFGNLNATYAGINGTVTANSYLISELASPLVDFEVNESGIFNNFTLECNITCNQSGFNCYDVDISAEYNPGAFIDITTLTTDLVNDEDNYSCGDLDPGESCIHIFNITAGINSGNNDWDLRCHGESSNAAAAISSNVQVHVNDRPVADFTYPLPSEWLHGTEILNGSDSTDSDGTVENYRFEIDDNLGFATPLTICDSSSETCSLDTKAQTECGNETSTCYLRLNVTDDDGTFNSTVIQVGIDNIGPNLTLGYPENFTFINTESQFVNSSAVDGGSGVDCVEFDAYYGGSWNSLNVDCSSTYDFNWDLNSVSDQEFIQIRSRANDSEGNFGVYDLHVNITHDTTLPIIVLEGPDDFEVFGITDLFFNFTATDNVANDFNCSLILDYSVNQSSVVSNDSSFGFFVEGLTEGEHVWEINCTDNASNSNNSESRNFTIDLTPPIVNLNFPDNNWLDSSQVTFNYTPEDLHLESCQLWGNWSSGWHLNETDFSLANGSFNTFTKNISDGWYVWNIWCNDTVGNSAFNSTNFTFGVDTVYPQISIENNTNEKDSYSSETFIFLNVSVVEDNIDSVWFSWNGVNESFDNSGGGFYWENKTGLSDGNYSFISYVNDSAGNSNYTENFTFVVDTSAPTWSNANQTVAGIYSDVFHRGEVINLSSYWNDVFGLKRAILSTNESGSWENISGEYTSPVNFTGLSNLSEFNWSDSSVSLGQEIYWTIYGEDLAGNYNLTSFNSFTIWGYSEASSISFSPPGIDIGESAIANCLIRDNSTFDPIEGYNVSFYNSTGLIGYNLTDSMGYAHYNLSSFQDAGSYTITCNITDDASKYYNASSNNEAFSDLGVGFLLKTYDYTNTTSNKAYEGTTNQTTTQIDDPYTDLESDDDTTYQTYRSPQGTYAFSRFEFKVYEPVNTIFNISVTWNGYGDNGNNGEGYILYILNSTSGIWQQVASYSVDNSEQTEFFSYSDDFGDFINSSGYLKVLVRSFEPAATTGSGGGRWAEVNTDYVKVDVYVDILPPSVQLFFPSDDSYNSSTDVEFICSTSDDYVVENLSLYGNWSSGWHLNETNSSGVNDANYTFNKVISDGLYLWDCYSCDRAGNCAGNPKGNDSFIIDTIAPSVNLVSPFDWENFTGYDISFFNFSVVDASPISKCELYGDWDPGWHLNQTYSSPERVSVLNFSGLSVEGDEFYLWNINCTDFAGNSAFNSSNFTFSAFLEPWIPYAYFINQTNNDGTGNVTLVWNSSNHSYEFEIHYSDDMKSFNYLNKTSESNYTDITFSGNKRRYYNVVATNPIGQNSSVDYFGAHVYTLKHDGTDSRNLLGFPTNFSYLTNANETFREANGAVSISTMNFTSQEIVYCNDFFCPSGLSCTPTSCNFDLVSGESYDLEINTTGSNEVNWSGVGIVQDVLSVDIGYNDPNVLKNRKWISLYAGTNLTNAEELFSSIGDVDAVTNWREDLQTSEGLIEACLPWAPTTCFYVGENFNLEVEKGYEVSSTAVGTWVQE